MRTAILIFFMAVGQALNGQMSFKEVDSTSLKLYSMKSWKQLADFGRTDQVKSFDFYYLNLRLGIANYETGRFSQAEKHFGKALEKNEAGLVAPKYLFWIYRLTKREIQAEEVFNSLPDSIRQTMNWQACNLLESVYLEAGPKFSDESDLAGTLFYASAGISHKFSPKLQLYQGYSWIQENMRWGNFRQHQYYLTPRLNFKNGWSLKGGLNLYDYKRNYDYQLENTEFFSKSISLNDTVMGLLDSTVYSSSELVGIYKQKSLGGHISIEKTMGNFSFNPGLSWFGEWQKPDFTEFFQEDTQLDFQLDGLLLISDTFTVVDTIVSNEPSFSYALQVGTGLDYTFRFNKNKSLTLGSEFHLVMQDSEFDFAIAPYFNLTLGNKFGLSGYYTKKGNKPVSLFGGSMVLNSYDELKHRFSLTGNYVLSQRMSLYSTFQWDQTIDNLLSEQYNSYSVFTGIKIKL